MKIGIIASIWIRVPPKGFGFGAQEYLAYYIAEGMKKKGHEVTLFATGDSQVSTRLISVSPTQIVDMPSKDARTKDVFELMNLSEAYKASNEFDILHNHLLPYGLLFTPLVKTPTVHTLHHEIHKTRTDFYLYEKFRNQNYISISHAQRTTFPSLNYIATVYNGIDTTFYTFQEQHDNYMLYIGRMRRYKGIHTAIKVAQKMGFMLKIAAPMPASTQLDYNESMEYWRHDIEPFLSKDIEYLGTVEGKQKLQLLQNALVLLLPIEREEPFGITLIEAMACGTPVIAFARGSTPEIIKDGETGFLINPSDTSIKGNYVIKKTHIEGICDAVKKIYAMDEKDTIQMRRNSRTHIENHFTVEKMVDKYETVYKTITNTKT